ncbi:MAG: hypothetical protein AB7L76_03910 [Burkholderiaceae bacterium]
MNTTPPIGLPQRRIGVLVPPANPTVELEYPVLCPAGAALHVMRLPIIAGDLSARNQGYLDSYETTLRGFGSLKLDAVAIALTGAQYRIGYAADQALCERLSQAAGARVETASVALHRAIEHLGIRRISLVSPYPDWLTALAVRYWTDSGITVDHVERFEDELVAYRVTTAEVAERLRGVQVHGDGAVILTGTGMQTIDAILQVGAGKGVPVLSSNLCSMWSLTRQLGATAPDWARAAFPSLFTS